MLFKWLHYKRGSGTMTKSLAEENPTISGKTKQKITERKESLQNTNQ